MKDNIVREETNIEKYRKITMSNTSIFKGKKKKRKRECSTNHEHENGEMKQRS